MEGICRPSAWWLLGCSGKPFFKRHHLTYVYLSLGIHTVKSISRENDRVSSMLEWPCRTKIYTITSLRKPLFRRKWLLTPLSLFAAAEQIFELSLDVSLQKTIREWISGGVDQHKQGQHPFSQLRPGTEPEIAKSRVDGEQIAEQEYGDDGRDGQDTSIRVASRCTACVSSSRPEMVEHHGCLIPTFLCNVEDSRCGDAQEKAGKDLEEKGWDDRVDPHRRVCSVGEGERYREEWN